MRFFSSTICTLALTLLPTLAAAEFEATLFSTPEERAYLDYLRQELLASQQERGFNIVEEALPEIPDAANEPDPPRYFTLGGIASRRDGGHTIWLNGRALSESELQNGTRLATESGVLGLRFATDAGSRFLKPGQTIELNSGEVSEDAHKAAEAPELTTARETAAQEAGVEVTATDTENETPPAPETPGDSVEAISVNTLEQLQQVLETLQNTETNEQ